MRLSILFILLVFCQTTFAGQIVDSLKQVLPTQQGEERVNTLNQLGYHLRYSDLKTALESAHEANTLAADLGLEDQLSTSYQYLGMLYSIKGDYALSIENANAAIATLKDRPDKKTDLANTHNVLGATYLGITDYPKALQSFINAKEIYESLGDTLKTASSLNNVGVVYERQSEYEKALELYTECLELFVKMDNQTRVAMTYNNIGYVLLGQKKYEEALESFLDAEKLVEELNIDMLKMTVWSNIGETYENLSELTKAEAYYAKAKENAIESGSVIEEIEVLNLMASVALKRGEHAKAIGLAESALQKATGQSVLDEQMMAHRTISRALEKQGKHKLSLEHFQEYSALKDTITSETRSEQLAEMQVKFDTERQIEKKQFEIQNLEQEAIISQKEAQRKQLIYIGIIVVIVLALALALLVMKSYALRAQAAQANEEKLELENEKLEANIKHKNRELSSNAMFVHQKNLMLTRLKAQVDDLSKTEDDQVARQARTISVEINQNINLEEEWNTIKLHFEEVYPGYFKTLTEQCPKLTQLELKHCAYLKMNLSIKEIAKILHVEPKSVQMSHYRLKKKLELPEKQSVSAFAQSI